MPTKHSRQRMELLLARLEPAERVLARGRAFEPPDPLRLDLSMVSSGPGCVLAVTGRRVLWVGRDDQRWVRSRPFALVRSYTKITQAHRYALALDHQRIDAVRWVPAHQLLWWSWGTAEAVGPVTGSVLAFSRRDTKAAWAIRSRLQASGVPAGQPRSLPKRARPGEVASGFLRPHSASADDGAALGPLGWGGAGADLGASSAKVASRGGGAWMPSGPGSSRPGRRAWRVIRGRVDSWWGGWAGWP